MPSPTKVPPNPRLPVPPPCPPLYAVTPLNWGLSEAVGGKICLELVNGVKLEDVCLGNAWWVGTRAER